MRKQFCVVLIFFLFFLNFSFFLTRKSTQIEQKIIVNENQVKKVNFQKPSKNENFPLKIYNQPPEKDQFIDYLSIKEKKKPTHGVFFKETNNILILFEGKDYQVIYNKTSGIRYTHSPCPVGKWWIDYHHKNLIYHNLYKNFAKICEDNDIEWMIGFGNLFGVSRDSLHEENNGGMGETGMLTFWDGDADVFVRNSDIHKLKRLPLHYNDDIFLGMIGRNKENDGKVYQTITGKGGVNYRIFYQHNHTKKMKKCQTNGIATHPDRCYYIDIFGFDERGNDLRFYIPGKNMDLKYQDFYPIKECSFLDVSCKCPNKIFPVLKKIYGENLSRPFYCDTEIFQWRERYSNNIIIF